MEVQVLRLVALLAVPLGSAFVHCGSEAELVRPPCTPGETAVCACLDGRAGRQLCGQDRTFGGCDCPDASADTNDAPFDSPRDTELDPDSRPGLDEDSDSPPRLDMDGGPIDADALHEVGNGDAPDQPDQDAPTLPTGIWDETQWGESLWGF